MAPLNPPAHHARRAGSALLMSIATAAAPALPPDTGCRTVAVPLRDPSSWAEPSASISTDGRYLAFASYERLLPQDTNSGSDIYVFDFDMGRLTIESLLPSGASSNGDSQHPRISADGRFVVFDTLGTLLPESQLATRPEVVLRDRLLGTIRVLVRGAGGERPNGPVAEAVISADGRVVAFTSAATNVVPGDDGRRRPTQVLALTIATGAIRLVSVSASGGPATDGASFSPSISDDGRYVAFTSRAVLGDGLDRRRARSEPTAFQESDVFVRDLEAGTTRLVSRRTDGRAPNGPSYGAALSGDGRYVAFVSQATDLARDDDNRASDVFLHDLATASTELVSRDARGRRANGASARPAISRDGRVVAFESTASNLVCARRCAPRDLDINLVPDVFVLDRARGGIRRLSGGPDGPWTEPSHAAVIDGSGETIVFSSRQPIDDADTAVDFDLFVQRPCGRELTRAARPAAC